MKRKKRIAVIGAGTSGLIALKCIKEEKENIEPICFERSGHIGGIWYYHEDDSDDIASVSWSTFINNSKEMWSFSNFPPKKEWPNFMRHTGVYQTFLEMATTFDLLKHIQFYCEVLRVKKAEDYEVFGKWQVTIKNSQTNKETTEEYDGVLVCSGSLTYPNIPDFPNLEAFQGKIIHTKSLKKVSRFRDQNVAVVGIGSSGLDAAVEISNVAKQVYLSSRSGTWVIPRLGPRGIPTDYSILRRSLMILQNILPLKIICKLFQSLYLDHRFSHDLYSLKPEHSVVARDPAVNDIIAIKLSSGTVLLKNNIKYFLKEGVIFDGEDEVTELDSVILATGYKWKFPFFDEKTLITEGNMIHLYKCMYPAHLKHPTLAIIGFIVPLGPGFPVVEMQCRWAVQLLLGKCDFLSPEEMAIDVEKQYETNANRFVPCDRISVIIDYIPYMDDIASKIGAKPNLLKLAITDPKLFYHCVFGPVLPYQYRLQGPHRWNEAREAILTSYKRMTYPLLLKKCRSLEGLELIRFKPLLYILIDVSIFGLLYLLWLQLKKPSVQNKLIKIFIPYVILVSQTVYRFLKRKKY